MDEMALSVAYFFRETDANPHLNQMHPVADEETAEEPSDAEEAYLCAQCRHVITRRAEEIQVHGTHAHTFANPLGIVFEIGCFRYAPGCAVVGPASDEFTWFRGYQWKIAYCRYCLTHLGWHFSNSGGDDFYGLIIDRLMLTRPGGQ